MKPAAAGTLREKCPAIRRDLILKMFRVGYTAYGAQLSEEERVRRRLGGQFAHEPLTSMKETISLGEALGEITSFEVTLMTSGDNRVSATCKGLAMVPTIQ